MRSIRIALAGLMAASLLPAATAPDAASEGFHSDNMEFVQNFPYGNRFGIEKNYGTDSDFIQMEIDVDGDGAPETRDVGVFGSINNGAFIMDVTDGAPVQLGWYECSIGQGDVQVFQRTTEDGEVATYFTFTDDGYTRANRGCVAWAKANRGGDFDAAGGEGTYIVDMTDPTSPTTVNFVPFALGSHNQTVHPSTNYLYNSNSELITNAANAGIEIFDITDLTDAKSLGILELPVRPGLGTDAHDITFNADGSRAYVAALSQTVILDTEDPANPTILSSFMDPMINVEHQANPVTVTDPLLGEREFLIVEDEFAGAAGAEQTCPSGGVHVYDITGDLEKTPVKVGFWNIAEVRKTTGVLDSCTAHVFEIYEDAGIMTMAFYNGGIRVIDIRGLVGAALGGDGLGMRELGYYRFADSDSWSVKAADIEVGANGELDFYLYSNDIARGLDTFRFTGNIDAVSENAGQWMTAAELANARLGVEMPADYQIRCLLKPTAA